ncbi:hypothetical protein [Serratia proteamaculans]|nr:hypothetical protein [Serratia proteamaculans]
MKITKVTTYRLPPRWMFLKNEELVIERSKQATDWRNPVWPF